MTSIVALALLMLAGCSAPAAFRSEWTKPDVALVTQRRDEYECERQAVFLHATARERAAGFAACMEARGYARAR